MQIRNENRAHQNHLLERVMRARLADRHSLRGGDRHVLNDNRFAHDDVFYWHILMSADGASFYVLDFFKNVGAVGNLLKTDANPRVAIRCFEIRNALSVTLTKNCDGRNVGRSYAPWRPCRSRF